VSLARASDCRRMWPRLTPTWAGTNAPFRTCRSDSGRCSPCMPGIHLRARGAPHQESNQEAKEEEQKNQSKKKRFSPRPAFARRFFIRLSRLRGAPARNRSAAAAAESIHETRTQDTSSPGSRALNSQKKAHKETRMAKKIYSAT
jgi:hypothetical protein